MKPPPPAPEIFPPVAPAFFSELRDMMIDAVFLDIVEVTVRRHFTHVDRKVRVSHLLFDGSLQSPRTVGGMKNEMAFCFVVQRPEKRDSLDVVPVKV